MSGSSSRFDHPDAQRSHLRGIVATIADELSRLQDQGPTGGPTDRLLGSWAELVATLALGPEPEMRECPVCHHIGMRAATLCGHCWTTLVPPTLH